MLGQKACRFLADRFAGSEWTKASDFNEMREKADGTYSTAYFLYQRGLQNRFFHRDVRLL